MSAIYDYNQDLKVVFDSFQQSVNQPYLKKFMKEPVFDEDQAAVLLMMLKEKGLSERYIHDCILTTMLIQAALDTHEAINIHGLGTETIKTKRQLTVLAGDYYSSLYYLVLSKLKDVSLIRVFARSIQEINESKMNIYKQNKKKVQPSVHDLKKINASLLTNLADFFELTHFKEMIGEFFLLKNLLIERFSYMESGYRGMALNFFQEIVDQKMYRVDDKYLINKFNMYIELSKLELNQSNQSNSPLYRFITLRINDLFHEYQTSEKYAVEEG